MLLRFDANLRGQSFAALDPLVILTDIEETAAEADIETAKRALHAGTRLTYSRRRQLSIRLKNAAGQRVSIAKAELAVEMARLQALRPGAPLERGYALIEQGGKIAENAAQLREGGANIRMKDGGWAAELVHPAEGSAWEHAQEKGTDVCSTDFFIGGARRERKRNKRAARRRRRKRRLPI